jgi:histone-lysine N-methyltransferase SUV420H
VCTILREDVIVRKDAGLAHANLLRLPGITKYVRSLRTQDEKEHFERHLRKYVNMYLPECPFEVCTTNRYTILTHEACVVARRPISPGESIKFLTGIQVEMTEKEEEELSSRTDFSIVISSRRKRPSLFLGPARFANHDCDSNARLSTSGPHGINIVARKHIQTGDEITVQYGDNYFGEDNCECLCASCEKAVRNGWDPKGPVLPDSDSDDSSDEEEESKPSRKGSVKPKREPVAKAIGPLKRKRDESTPAEGSRGPGLPRKRGRWTKASNGNKLTTGAKAKGSVQASQKTMAEWFAKRAIGELDLDAEEEEGEEEEGREEEKDEDEDENEETLDDLHEQFQIKKRPTARGQQPQQRHSKKQSLFGKVFGYVTGATTRSIAKLEAEIREMNEQTATLMQIDAAEVPAHYKQAEPMLTQAQVDFMKGKLRSPSEPSKDDDDDTTKADWDWATVEASPEKSERRSASKKTPSSSPEVRKSGKSPRFTDRFAQAKQSSTSGEKGRSKSNLRNVLNADDDDDDDDEIDIYEVPESPPPEETSRRTRIKPRKNPPRHDSNQRIEATQNSTDSSSISSVFSTEGAAGEASSLSSTEQSPDRLDGFAAGRICQNIVEMYTTETSPVNDDWEEERKLSDARINGWEQPRGRLPVRKSSRRNLLAAPSQPITSIEPATQVKTEEGEDDEDGEGCKRGPIRTPGDFHLTAALLATTYHRWVECRNCDEFFVQAEAYLTRIACPRCERHSKLYGYYWPKTDREGKHDTEERVLDHRTIHRFIDPEDERMEKKGKKGLAEVIRDRETSSRLQSEALSDGRFDRLRNSPRRSESRRKTRSSMA